MPEKTGSPDVPDLEIEGVEPVEGGTTIAELFNNRQAYGGQVIKVKGIVVKYSEAIMKKNWVHIQDGTRDQGEFDLAITTSDECALGDEVGFEGMITLDKDFGYGYSYDVIMEDAKLVEVKKATTLQ